MNADFKYRGRIFAAKDLKVVDTISKKYFDHGISYISREICRELNWKQPNGWLKDRACRDVLRKLESLQLIKLPKIKIKNKAISKGKNEAFITPNPIHTVHHCIELKFAKGNSSEKIWNSLVQQYHYLGHSVLVGKCIKYLIYSNDILLGAISFSSPVKNVGIRNEVYHTLGIREDSIEELVVNNSRFLILPHVKVKNLASSILSLATKKIVEDWKWYYLQTPLIVETFVQISRFEGTCYKAANWSYIGDTKGYSKRGHIYYANNQPKYIFIYGLNKKIRRAVKQVNKIKTSECKV